MYKIQIIIRFDVQILKCLFLSVKEFINIKIQIRDYFLGSTALQWRHCVDGTLEVFSIGACCTADAANFAIMLIGIGRNSITQLCDINAILDPLSSIFQPLCSAILPFLLLLKESHCLKMSLIIVSHHQQPMVCFVRLEWVNCLGSFEIIAESMAVKFSLFTLCYL